MIREIVTVPAEILTRKTNSVREEDMYKVRELGRDLLETMIHYSGMGIAAPQIGINMAVCVIGNVWPILLINPVIVSKGERGIKSEESCLSIPNKMVMVLRYNWIEIMFKDEYGSINKLKLSGLKSIIAQHEIDHLNGVLITDYEKISDKYISPDDGTIISNEEIAAKLVQKIDEELVKDD